LFRVGRGIADPRLEAEEKDITLGTATSLRGASASPASHEERRRFHPAPAPINEQVLVKVVEKDILVGEIAAFMAFTGVPCQAFDSFNDFSLHAVRRVQPCFGEKVTPDTI